ncbi:helix-turn-helix domain-containing protein [Phycicoccus sp. 3266]|uniref:helix-turn-helix domain-containing protein n=1 Tax=Phycicoccus sp. 3266 TaxID=2817751 RepID=UPI002867862C|nr:helix-turn-helix domain-containing protein [Phycicoccus sp. 3266]MDR6861937.1 DNA-binding NarL/FixJ family response regulator [Phycicoccus sp. 3266]
MSRLAAARERVSPISLTPLSQIRNVYVEPPSQAARPARGATRIDRVEVAALYRRGASGPEIAKLLGCTTGTVYKALEDQGVQRREAHRYRKDAS